MLYWLFYWTYLVFILSNLHNITSQYCVKLCNNMAYTSHHCCKPNWPQSFNCSQLLTQTFLAAASRLGKSFSERTWFCFCFFFICLHLRFPLGQRSQTFLLTSYPLLEFLYIHFPPTVFPESPFHLNSRGLSGGRMFPSLIAGLSQFLSWEKRHDAILTHPYVLKVTAFLFFSSIFNTRIKELLVLL